MKSLKDLNVTDTDSSFFLKLKEMVKSKFDKDYVLTNNSPAILYKNKKLLKRTLEKMPHFVERLVEQAGVDKETALRFAVEAGYITGYRNPITSNGELLSKYIDVGGKFSELEFWNHDIFEDDALRQKMLEYARENDCVLGILTPTFLRGDKIVALKNFKRLFSGDDKDVDLIKQIGDQKLLNSNLILDESFLKEFLALAESADLDKAGVFNMILNISDVSERLKEQTKLVNELFNYLQPEDLSSFFERVKISSNELDDFFENDFEGNLAELAGVYSINPLAIETINGELLGRGIPMFKLQEYSADEKFQKELLALSPFKYSLFKRITDNNLSKIDRWNRLDSRTLDNLFDGYYDNLIADIMKEEQNGNVLTQEELDVLSNLFSAKVTGPEIFKSMGIPQRSNNIFNITTRKELSYYHQIRETICDIVIMNPDLDDSEDLKKYHKYLKNFKDLAPVDRVKLAILQKTFGMNLDDARVIMENFGQNIDSFTSFEPGDEATVEQIKAISNVLSCDDIEVLQLIGQETDSVVLDFDQGTFLFDEAKRVFEKDLKKDLYSPRKEDYMFEYSGVEVYNAPLEFESITKFSGAKPDKSKWEKSRGNFNDKNIFRRKSCMSFTNGELLNPTSDGCITFGIGKSIGEFQFGGMYTTDAHTYIDSDMVYWNFDEEGAKYMGKADFVSETIGKYDEVIVDTLMQDDKTLSNKKLMPEYIVYYQLKSDMTLKERENDINWQNAIEAAKEFGVPIVNVDCEAIRANELRKIRESIRENLSDYRSVKTLVGRVKHYIDRYGNSGKTHLPEISELISPEELVAKETFLERSKPKRQYVPSGKKINLQEKINDGKRKLREAGIIER